MKLRIKTKLQWNGTQAKQEIAKALLGAVVDGAEDVLTEAIDETPIDTGTLRRSGFVSVRKPPNPEAIYAAARSSVSDNAGGSKSTRKKLTKADLSATVVYITFNTPYALRQHEDLNLNHPRGGGPKYLENPFNRNKKKILRLAATRVRAALKKGK